MSFDLMPDEIKQEFALSLNLKELSRLCTTSSENKSNLCEDEVFIGQWIRKNKPQYLKLYLSFMNYSTLDEKLKPLTVFQQIKEHIKLGGMNLKTSNACF